MLAPTRRHERLMGQGRTTYKRVGVKLEKVGADYDPRSDTCLKAFVRLMAQLALDSAGGGQSSSVRRIINTSNDNFT